MVPKSKIWKEQWGLKWSPFFISAPFKLTIESSQWKSRGCARIQPASQHHTKKRHSDVSVWSVAMELQDNQHHGCLCKLVTPYHSQKKKKRKEGTTYLWVPSSWDTWHVKFTELVKSHKFVPEGSAIINTLTPSISTPHAQENPMKQTVQTNKNFNIEKQKYDIQSRRSTSKGRLE